MKEAFGSRTARIDAPGAARLLRDPRVLQLVGAFLERAALLSDVARELDIPLSTAWRMVTRLVACDVLRVRSIERRAGRALRRYQAVAPVLFLPYEAEGDRLPDDVVRGLVEMRVDEQVRGLMAAAGLTLRKSGVLSWGTVIYADRHGHLVVRPDFETGRTPALLASDGPAYLNFYSDDLRLTSTQAKRLQIELVALLKRYKACTGTSTYTVSAVLAPLVRPAKKTAGTRALPRGKRAG
jgi:hypothetical protein